MSPEIIYAFFYDVDIGLFHIAATKDSLEYLFLDAQLHLRVLRRQLGLEPENILRQLPAGLSGLRQRL